jgi:hypothetical protein
VDEACKHSDGKASLFDNDLLHKALPDYRASNRVRTWVGDTAQHGRRW